MPEEPEPEDELLPDLDEVDDLAFVPVLPLLALADVEPEPVVDDLLPLPDDEEEDEVGELEEPKPEEPRFEEPEPELDPIPEPELDFELDPESPELLPIPVLLPIDDEFEDPDVLPDMLPELWFFSLSFIVKISWIYIVKKIRAM